MSLKISQASLRRAYTMLTGNDTSSSLQGLSNLPAELVDVLPVHLVMNHPSAPLNTVNTGFPSGSADVIAPQTVVSSILSGGADGATVYTVPAGKTFYCTAFWIQNGSTTTRNSATLTGAAALTPSIICEANTTGTTTSGSYRASFVSGISPLFTVAGGASGQTITMSGFGAGNNSCMLSGWIQ